MARHRIFTAGKPPTTDQQVSFDLTGQYTDNPAETWTERFTCVGLAPAGVLDDLSSAISNDPVTGMRRYNSRSCMGFVRQVLVDGDKARFEALLHDTNRIVGLLELVEIVAWLSDELTLRPTQPSSGSAPGGGTPDGEATPEAAAGSLV